MKKGIAHLIPVVAIALVLSVGSVGLIGIQRNQSLEGNLLTSPEEVDNIDQIKGQKDSSNSESQSSSAKNSSQSKNPVKVETSQKTKETQMIKKSEVDEVEDEDEDEEESEASPTTKPKPSTTPGRKIRTHFPITVNPLTNEKIVTTPSGVKVIILPEVAIRNMIKAGFPVVLPPEPSPEPSPEGTPSATPEASPEVIVSEDGVVLTEFENQLAYEIPAIKDERFLGLMSVKIKIKGYVSAENGNILKIQKSFFDNILDFLSF